MFPPYKRMYFVFCSLPLQIDIMKVLAICGSLRRKSSNLGLVKYAASNAPADMQIIIADLSDVPLYNQDLVEPPTSVKTLMSQCGEADALLLACPEYNYSIAPALKNAIDWLSRAPNNALLAGKPVAIMGAGGEMGTSRAQYHLRQVCVYVDLHPLNKPEVFCNAFAGTFDADSNLIDPSTQESIRNQLVALQDMKRKLSSS